MKDDPMDRRMLLDHLAHRLLALPAAHPARVAIDGIDAAGKTMLANDLLPLLAQRPVIRASIDGFHRTRAQRYRQGAESPRGYYEDSFDYLSLRKVLLAPLGPGGTLHYHRAVFDFRTDTPIHPTVDEVAPHNAILLFDGVFLQRPELDDLWEYRIFVHVPFAVALERAMQRDQPLFGSTDAVRTRYERRYIPAQRLYLDTVRPQQHADITFDNSDPRHPYILE